MKVLVTGGAGFIGSQFVRMFDRGDFPAISHVTVLDALTYAGNLENLPAIKGNIAFVRGSICDSEVVSGLVENHDAVINFAAESHVDRSISNSAEFIQTNINGVHNLIESIRSSGRDVRYLQVSTDEVYGSIDAGSWDEACPLLPNSPYSASKASGDLLVRSYAKTHGLDAVITRCSNNYGTHHFPEKLFPLFITNLIDGKKVPVYGNGLNVRDWLNVEDHCRGIYLALTQGRSGEIYNIGGGTELTNIEIANKILELMGCDDAMIEYVEDRKGHDLRYSVDWSKSKRELGYEPQVDFEIGLQQTINWYRDNEAWWRPLLKK